MATVNLGSIKFKWKGTYSGATAYTIDDVVEYNGSSYICISNSTGNLPTNATYFEQMSAKGADGTNGTNGTDLTTTLTTQGDLVYRDGSGLQRLGAGTAGQVLQTGGAGANPSWSTVSSDWVKLLDTSVTSTSATVSIDGYFSSSYDIYKVYYYGLVKDANTQIWLRFNSGGTAITSSSYTHLAQYIDFLSGATDGNNCNTNYNRIIIGWQSTNADNASGGEFTFFDPNANARTEYPRMHYHTHSYDGGGYHYDLNGWGLNNTTTGAISGFTFTPDGGNITAIKKILVYGLKN
jgi:hypothetical protein